MSVRKGGLGQGDDALRLMVVVVLLGLIALAGALGGLWTVLAR